MAPRPIIEAEVELDIQFYDTDMMGVVWHGNYLKYFEIARCELLRKFNYDYLDMAESGYVWPIVDMRIKYVSSAKFGQRIKVIATLVEYEFRMKINYLVIDVVSGVKLTKGYTVQVAVNLSTKEMCMASPDILLARLRAEGSCV